MGIASLNARPKVRKRSINRLTTVDQFGNYPLPWQKEHLLNQWIGEA